MSITYVITTLFRGDDIEQVEYVIAQLSQLSDQPRQILVFNGGLFPKNQKWLEGKYPTVKVIELEAPGNWNIQKEFHYYNFVCTQLYKYVDTEFYLKMDRDVCIFHEGIDSLLINFMKERPDIAAAGTLAWCTRNFHIDGKELFDWLPQPVSFRNTKVLNGGVEIFRTSSMKEVGPMVEEHARQLWLESLDVAEDDLISFTLQGMGHHVQDCPYLLSLGSVEPSTVLRERYDAKVINDIRANYARYCMVHGFKPFAQYRTFYSTMHHILGRTETIESRNQANDKDVFCTRSRRNDLAKSISGVLGNSGVEEPWSYVEPLLTRPFYQDELTALEKCYVQISDIYAHLPTLYETTKDRNLKQVLELGTCEGNSLLTLLFAAKEIGGHVVTVDTEICPVAKMRVEREGLSDWCTFLQDDDLATEWHTPIDHLFIDTIHTYDQVLKELRKFEPYVVSGGVITLHDTTSHPELWDAITAYFKGRQDTKIRRWFHNNGLALIEKS